MTPRRTSFFTLIAVNLAVFAVLFVIVELILRAIYCLNMSCDFTIRPRTYPGQFENRGTPGLKPNSDLGWVMDPHHTNKHNPYRLNREGFRHDRDFARIGPAGGRRRIMLLGDSFAFGYLLPEGESLADHLQQRLGAESEVFNLALPGWGVDQMLLAYEKYAPIIRPDIVILVFIDADIGRALDAFRPGEGLNKPAFAIRNGTLVRRRAGGPSLVERIAGTSLILYRYYRITIVRSEKRRLAEGIFDRLADLTDRAGGRLIVVRYPSQQQVLRGKDPAALHDFGDFFRERSVTYLQPLAAMRAATPDGRRRFYLENDGHPAGAGNAFVAAFIEKAAGLEEFVHGE